MYIRPKLFFGAHRFSCIWGHVSWCWPRASCCDYQRTTLIVTLHQGNIYQLREAALVLGLVIADDIVS